VFYHDLNAPITNREIEQIGHIDYILNLASSSDVQGSIDDPTPFVRNNTNIMLSILAYAEEIKPEVFLQFSTDEVYGATPKDSGGHPEWDMILPSNPYSASKACQEALAIAYWRSFGLPLIITNTMNNFGEMQGLAKFPVIIQKNIKEGKVTKVHSASNGEIGTRYYIHSRNAADAVLFILKNVKPVIHGKGELDKPVRLNIVGDKQVSNLELVETIARLMGKKAKTELVYFHESNPGHDLHYGLDGTKLKELGWKAPISFEESMKSTIEWQQRNHKWIE
jgi:dTDP-glucose 4,6-dehydratase